jgi:hypothetical protein
MYNTLKLPRALILLLGLLIVFFNACSSDELEEMEEDEEEEMMEEMFDCEGVDVSYTMDIVPIINETCALSGCHVSGGSGNGDFSTYAGLKAKADNGSLESRALIQMNMPPSNSSGPTSLSDSQKLIIACWIQDGAPEN